MKTIKLTKLVLVCGGALLLAGPAWSQERVATVNMDKIFDRYWKTGKLDEALDDWTQQMNKAEHPLVAACQKARDEYQQLLAEADDPTLPAADRAARQEAADEKLASVDKLEANLADFERTSRATLAIRQGRMRNFLLADITAAIDEQAKADGYARVLDSGARTVVPTLDYDLPMPVVVYSDPTNDITQQVLSQLNAEAPANGAEK
jgi:outer membrane protein